MSEETAIHFRPDSFHANVCRTEGAAHTFETNEATCAKCRALLYGLAELQCPHCHQIIDQEDLALRDFGTARAPVGSTQPSLYAVEEQCTRCGFMYELKRRVVITYAVGKVVREDGA